MKTLVNDEKTNEKTETIGQKIDLNNIDTSQYKRPEVKPKEIDDFMSGYTANLDQKIEPEQTDDEPVIKVKRKRRKAKNVIVSGEIINGALLMTLINLIIPMLMAAANNGLTKTQIKANDLRLSVTQINELEPIANACAKELELHANPFVMLIASLMALYGVNLMTARMQK